MKMFFCLLGCVLTSGAFAKIISKPVSYEVGGIKMQGFLAYDDSQIPSTKSPGVLVFHEWWGLNDYVKDRAQKLAAMGYVAFAPDMYGQGENTTDATKAKQLMSDVAGKPAMAERAQAGLEQLLKTGLVNDRKVGAIGYCFGGTTCQVLAYSGASLAGIVSFHGNLVTPTPEQVAKVQGRFLILNGAIDPMVKADDIKSFTQALDKGKIDYQFINYSGALHAFSNPNATALAAANNMSAMVGYNEPASRRSWAHMEQFFGEILKGP